MDEKKCLGYLAVNIRLHARKKGKAIETVADLAGLSRATLWAILSEKHYPTLKTLVRLANALECRPGVLLDAPEDKGAPRE